MTAPIAMILCGIMGIVIGFLLASIRPSKEEVMQDHPGLETYEMERARAEQLAFNCRWLIAQFDELHRLICPKKMGTWQERVKQVVEEVKSYEQRSS